MDNWLFTQLQKYYKTVKNLSVLDYGSGSGANSLMLARYGAEVFAFDKSPEKISNLQTAARQSGLTIQTQVCSALDFIPTQPYDIVLFTNVLHFIPKEDRPIALDIVVNSVKPNGLLVYCDLADDNPPEEETRTELYKKLKDIDEGYLYLNDKPHPGADYQHKHRVHYLLGKKII